MKFNRDLYDFELRIAFMRKSMRADVEEIVDDFIQTGAKRMDEFISTRGIKKPGRIDTDNMRGSVTATESEWTGDSVKGKFGWPKAYAEDYFFYQENGFYNSRAQRDIPPMHALLDAYIEAREKFLDDLATMWGK